METGIIALAGVIVGAFLFYFTDHVLKERKEAKWRIERTERAKKIAAFYAHPLTDQFTIKFDTVQGMKILPEISRYEGLKAWVYENNKVYQLKDNEWKPL